MADMISTLPDGVLCHILSFLKTKQAVATSILSTRWKHLWISVPVLDFSSTRITDPNDNFRFNDFVYSVLLSRDSTLPIKSFHLYVIHNYSEYTSLRLPSFAKWINFVLQRGGVEYLNLHVGLSGWTILPNTVFTCRTLVILKLFFFVVDLSFSSDFLLPSLKTLHLQFITLPEHEDFLLLLAGCPILQDLRIIDLYFDYKEEDSLSCNKWKSFSLNNLTKADVDSTYFQFPLKPLHNVQSLSMCIATAQVSCYNDFIPTFHNLTHLNLDSFNYRWNFLLQVLKHCPKLQNLSLDETGLNMPHESLTREDDIENWVDPDFVPQCISLHLRTCDLSILFGLQGELQLASYILKNARVLQTMRIWTSEQPEVERLLSSCQRASSTCKLTVHYVPLEVDESDSDDVESVESEPGSPMDARGTSVGSND